MYPRTIRNFNTFIDGVSWFGRGTTLTLPKLELQTSEHRGAGMDAPIEIDMGQSVMTSEMAFAEWGADLFRYFGTKQRLTHRPAAMGQNDFSADAFIFTVGGMIKGVEPGELKPGQDAPVKLMQAVDYLRIERNGEDLIEIDVENGKRVIGGTDQLAELRRAMGL
jgi:P2 family phage contractile tail tube protein